jgi:hypothetical protein
MLSRRRPTFKSPRPVRALIRAQHCHHRGRRRISRSAASPAVVSATPSSRARPPSPRSDSSSPARLLHFAPSPPHRFPWVTKPTKLYVPDTASSRLLPVAGLSLEGFIVFAGVPGAAGPDVRHHREDQAGRLPATLPLPISAWISSAPMCWRVLASIRVRRVSSLGALVGWPESCFVPGTGNSPLLLQVER